MYTKSFDNKVEAEQYVAFLKYMGKQAPYIVVTSFYNVIWN